MKEEALKSAVNDWLCDRAECTVFSALNLVSLLPMHGTKEWPSVQETDT